MPNIFSPYYHYCQVAEVAYGDRSPESLGYTKQSDIDTGGLYATCLVMPVELVMVFRGSVNLRDWILDLDAIPSTLDGLTVHQGFKDAWLTLMPWAKQAVTASGGRKVTVVGHSLGAAIATLAAYDLPQTTAAWTFGSPRVGMADFVAAYTRRDIVTHRVVHDCDMVPTLPMAPFHHVPGGVHITDDGATAPIDDSDGVRPLRQLLADIGGAGEKAHLLPSYLNAILNIKTLEPSEPN